MIVRTEAIAQVGSDSLDCSVQLTLPQVVALVPGRLCFDFTGKLVFVVWGAIEFKKTLAVETRFIQTKPTPSGLKNGL